MDFSAPTPGSVVVTRDGSLTLSHEEHGECFHNQAGAETEARELNVRASGFEARLVEGPLAVLDVGLGLGYNAVVTIEAWLAAPLRFPLHLVSLEIDADLVSQLASGAAPWQANWDPSRVALCRALRPTAEGRWRAVLGDLVWEVFVLDARTEPVPAASLPYGFVWQDPFSPERNPGMWDSAWFSRLCPVVAADVVLMTYSVARSVRDALAAAGWTPTRIPSRLPPKKQWLRATRV